MSAKCSVQLATRLVFGPLFSADYGPWARGARGICTSKKFFRKFRKEQIAWGKSNPWRCFLSRGMQNQQLINWSLGGASRLPSAGRHFAGEPSSPVIRPRHSPVRHFAPPRRGVGSSALSHLPGPPFPIFRRRRPRSQSPARCDVRGVERDAAIDRYPIHRVRCFCVDITSSSVGQALSWAREKSRSQSRRGLGLTWNGLADAWAALKQSNDALVRAGPPSMLNFEGNDKLASFTTDRQMFFVTSELRSPLEDLPWRPILLVLTENATTVTRNTPWSLALH
jgi:hypothetical protein